MLSKRRVSAAWLRVGILKCAVFFSGGERIIKVIKKPAARDNKIPAFHSIRRFFRSGKSGFVIADDFVQREIHRDSVRRISIVKIKNRNGRIRIRDFLFAITDVLRDQMFVFEILFGFDNDVGNATLPFV